MRWIGGLVARWVESLADDANRLEFAVVAPAPG